MAEFTNAIAQLRIVLLLLLVIDHGTINQANAASGIYYGGILPDYSKSLHTDSEELNLFADIAVLIHINYYYIYDIAMLRLSQMLLAIII
jgi:hypothetical protein